MKTGIQVQEATSEHVITIMQIREKIRLLNKCRRKMEMSVIDPDNYRIYVAAYKQLQKEIYELCREVGL
ncbi:MAG: hypothetical protein C4534_10080 [Gaiellales bacterium]|nr:MAG: hypothetical protein C4534_10080 [Gaiellales bacterium]